MAKKKMLYPGTQEAEAEKNRAYIIADKRRDNTPDFIGSKPNYDKYKGVDPATVLAWLNID